MPTAEKINKKNHCPQTGNKSDKDMKAEKNKVVAVSYELEVEGQIADKAGAEKPLEYIQGTGMLLPKFEAAVEGKEPGESFDFVLSPDEGYGEYNPDYSFDIPKASFEVDGKLREDLLVVGMLIPMLNSAGQVVQGTIKEIKAETVTMDFNHPMAGKTLHFTGKVETVRDATEKELTEGLHGEFLPPEEGCGHKCHHGDGEGCCHGEGGCQHGDSEGCCGEGDCNCGKN